MANNKKLVHKYLHAFARCSCIALFALTVMTGFYLNSDRQQQFEEPPAYNHAPAAYNQSWAAIFSGW